MNKRSFISLLKKKAILFGLLLVCLNFSFSQEIDPLLTEDYETQEKWVDSIYSSLSLEEKIGQLIMVMAFSEKGEEHFEEIESLVSKKKIGGIIFSLGGPVGQTKWLNRLQKKAKTPLLIGMDAEWGVAMRLDSVQPFPWNMTLGAIQDNKLIEKIGKRIGEQAKILGVNINFAPVLDINTNPKNPIIGNRSFGESKENVTDKGIAFMKGMHSAGVLSSGKHFPGHGDTSKDSHLELPVINFNEQRIDSIELYPYKKLIKEGISSVMIAHLNIPSIHKGVPSSFSRKIVTGLLKNDLKFKGLVITDALNMGATSDIKGIRSIDLASFLAGNDILLIPNNVTNAIKSIKRAYRRGQVTEARLAHSVKKILKAKYKSGLNSWKEIEIEGLESRLTTPLDEYLYNQAIANAVTVLNNKDKVLPLNPSEEYGFVTLGDSDGLVFYNELSKKIKLHKIDEKLSNEKIIEKLSPYKKVIIGFHKSDESPWKSFRFSKKERALVDELSKNHEVILDVFAKPYALVNLERSNEISGLMVSYQNSNESQLTSSHILTGDKSAIGRLPVSIKEIYKVGDGIDLIGERSSLTYGTPISVGLDEGKLKKIDELAKVVIDSMMAPGMQILVARKGKIVYEKSFGYHTYKKEVPVHNSDVYDLASLTKILATLPVFMQEFEKDTLSLDDTLGEIDSKWKKSNKANITIKEALSHYGRFAPWIPFYKETLNRQGGVSRKFYRKTRSCRFSLAVADNIYMKKRYADKMEEIILKSELRDTLEYKYSDLPFLMLKYHLERKNGMSLSNQAQDNLYRPLGLEKTMFNAFQVLPKEQIVPSEQDTYFRNQELRGEVHDMASAMLGGVGGNAGLFSNAKEVAIIMQLFLQKGEYEGKRFFLEKTFDTFNQRFYEEQGNRRGVGFDKPQLSGRGSTCGCVPASSFGHLGFTGTYTWADPENELIYVFLSNRTYPAMENDKLNKSNIRTRIQKYIYEAIIN